jgi:hypothetical protein
MHAAMVHDHDHLLRTVMNWVAVRGSRFHFWLRRHPARAADVRAPSSGTTFAPRQTAGSLSAFHIPLI